MPSVAGSIVLNGVTDKEMELIWAHKAKHEGAFTFNPQQIQPANMPPRGTGYNNVIFQYGDLRGLNVIAELANELHKRNEEAKVANR